MEFKTDVMHLAALRQSRGISLESIAAKTKVAVYYLRAIEDFEFEKLPTGVYRDTFLEQWAHAIDPDLAEDLGQKVRRSSREALEAQINSNPPNGAVRMVKDLAARGTVSLLLCNAATTLLGADNQAIVKDHDPRLHLLKKFFDERSCPAGTLAAHFLIAADRNGLDWRLLPSIAFLESSGGKYYRANNMFGWNKAQTWFRNPRHAIHYVGDRLANSPVYQGKTLRAKLRIYCPDRGDYADQILAVMEQISPSPGPNSKGGPRAQTGPGLQAKLGTAR